jgi:hypothetical protein
MIHLAALVLCLAGFTALALAVRRQQRDILGGALRPVATYVLRAVGTGGLLGALGALIAGYGWSLGLVMFSGHTSIAAGIVLCGLIGYLRSNPRQARHP